MDYGTIQAAGSRMGTGTMILMDDSICPGGHVPQPWSTSSPQESCGFCTPLPGGLALGGEAPHGHRGRPRQARRLWELLDRNAQFIGGVTNTFCLHAPGAIEPLSSALKYFREDFEEHIRTGKCPYASNQ